MLTYSPALWKRLLIVMSLVVPFSGCYAFPSLGSILYPPENQFPETVIGGNEQRVLFAQEDSAPPALLFGVYASLFIIPSWKVVSVDLSTLASTPVAEISGPGLSDGQWLAWFDRGGFGDRDPALVVRDIDSGHEQRLLSGLIQNPDDCRLAALREGLLLAAIRGSVSQPWLLVAFDVATGTQTPIAVIEEPVADLQTGRAVYLARPGFDAESHPVESYLTDLQIELRDLATDERRVLVTGLKAAPSYLRLFNGNVYWTAFHTDSSAIDVWRHDIAASTSVVVLSFDQYGIDGGVAMLGAIGESGIAVTQTTYPTAPGLDLLLGWPVQGVENVFRSFDGSTRSLSRYDIEILEFPARNAPPYLFGDSVIVEESAERQGRYVIQSLSNGERRTFEPFR